MPPSSRDKMRKQEPGGDQKECDPTLLPDSASGEDIDIVVEPLENTPSGDNLDVVVESEECDPTLLLDATSGKDMDIVVEPLENSRSREDIDIVVESEESEPGNAGIGPAQGVMLATEGEVATARPSTKNSKLGSRIRGHNIRRPGLTSRIHSTGSRSNHGLRRPDLAKRILNTGSKEIPRKPLQHPRPDPDTKRRPSTGVCCSNGNASPPVRQPRGLSRSSLEQQSSKRNLLLGTGVCSNVSVSPPARQPRGLSRSSLEQQSSKRDLFSRFNPFRAGSRTGTVVASDNQVKEDLETLGELNSTVCVSDNGQIMDVTETIMPMPTPTPPPTVVPGAVAVYGPGPARQPPMRQDDEASIICIPEAFTVEDSDPAQVEELENLVKEKDLCMQNMQQELRALRRAVHGAVMAEPVIIEDNIQKKSFRVLKAPEAPGEAKDNQKKPVRVLKAPEAPGEAKDKAVIRCKSTKDRVRFAATGVDKNDASEADKFLQFIQGQEGSFPKASKKERRSRRGPSFVQSIRLDSSAWGDPEKGNQALHDYFLKNNYIGNQ